MGWRDWVPISKSRSRKLDLAFSWESRMKMPSARPCRSNSSVFRGEKCDEHVRHFLSMECRRRGVSLVREGQNSLWANGSFCLLGNAQGMCLRWGEWLCNYISGWRAQVQESKAKERARVTQWRVCDCAERGLGSPVVEQSVPAASDWVGTLLLHGL